MSFLKRSPFSSIEALIYRFTKYKQENELTRRELWKIILLKSISILSFRIRRYRVIIQPNYDFYGWILRSIVQEVEDLYHESVLEKICMCRHKLISAKFQHFLNSGAIAVFNSLS